MEESYDTLETLGAVVSALGLAVILITEGRALGLGLLPITIGTVVWKMGEMRRELKGELARLREELELLKSISGVENG
ncbi:hypothetical protein [Thermococcus pacificus]|uniref:Uncharacterized protein n=1 Tax=Thermococcus pacificus TaxID=71998 RepID=A0A218P9Q2_9EURY|nr:hypothetical protein [Thermococcus pacificus]ASJ07509.1 hypothetical protein A3L08_09355 [Thermococcus pacificus]